MFAQIRAVLCVNVCLPASCFHLNQLEKRFFQILKHQLLQLLTYIQACERTLKNVNLFCLFLVSQGWCWEGDSVVSQTSVKLRYQTSITAAESIWTSPITEISCVMYFFSNKCKGIRLTNIFDVWQEWRLNANIQNIFLKTLLSYV